MARGAFFCRDCNKNNNSPPPGQDLTASDIASETVSLGGSCYILVLGAPLWQWTLWLSLWMPLGWLASFTVYAVEFIVGKLTGLSGNVCPLSLAEFRAAQGHGVVVSA